MATPGDSKPDNSSTAPFDNRGISYAAIETNFNTWSHQRRVDGAGDDYMNRVDAAKTTYLDIARKAEASGGFADPVAFVRTLGTHELDALQTINSLGAAIDPASLTEEGALNLLLTRTMARDIDGDGLMMVGEASTFVFPPGDAPQAVKDAWEKTTEGMDFGTKLHLQMSMHLAGNAVRAESGGSSVAADYSALVDRAIDGATFNLNISPSDQRAFNSKILDGLNLLRTYLSATDV
ncbi:MULTISPECIES: hypothetical protein [unclassified Rhizobium]|uniref:hypothetical protein n=1 Tax=Rhizobium sp. PP-CC-3G-465 TaxID=2135648 RepID=UPI000DA12258